MKIQMPTISAIYAYRYLGFVQGDEKWKFLNSRTKNVNQQLVS